MMEKPKTVGDCLQGVRHDEVDCRELGWWCRDWGGGAQGEHPRTEQGLVGFVERC